MEKKVTDMTQEERRKFAEKEKARLRKEREEKRREYWNNLPKIKEVRDIPELPYAENPEEWKSFYVVKLIEAGAIPKGLLKDGAYYLGDHRNATVALWCAEKNRFEYWRTKFTARYIDDCNHFEDDDGYALFVPIKEATQEQFERNQE
jgi:hypothetical protein